MGEGGGRSPTMSTRAGFSWCPAKNNGCLRKAKRSYNHMATCSRDYDLLLKANTKGANGSGSVLSGTVGSPADAAAAYRGQQIKQHVLCCRLPVAAGSFLVAGWQAPLLGGGPGEAPPFRGGPGEEKISTGLLGGSACPLPG